MTLREWVEYTESPQFKEDFQFAQKAFAEGDLGAIAERLHEAYERRAKERADKAKNLAKKSS